MHPSPVDTIQVSLSESMIRLGSGSEPVVLVASIRNASNVVDRYTLEVEGLNPSWYSIPRPTVSLFPGDAVDINVTLHPPWQSSLMAGRHDFEVRAYSDNRNRYGVSHCVLEITGQAALQVSMMPLRVKGRRGTFSVTINNTGTQSTHVELEGVDPELALRFAFKDREPTVDAYKSVTVPVTVKPKSFRFVGPEVRYPFDINVGPSDHNAATPVNSHKLAGELVHPAIFKSWVVPGFGSLLALVLALFLIIRPPLPGFPPSITFFVANPSTVPEGDEVVLRWEATNAVKATIAEDNREVPLDPTGKGELRDNPRLSRTYTLCVFNTSGSQRCSPPVAVTVLQTPPTPGPNAVAPTNTAAAATPVPPTVAARQPDPTTPPNPGGGGGGGGAGGGGGGGAGAGGGSGGVTPPPPPPATPTRVTAPSPVPATPTSPPPTVAAQCDPGGSIDGSANPASARANDTVTFQATGFTPGEQILFSVIDPDDELVGTSDPISGAVQPDGSLDIEPLPISEDFTRKPGRWTATFLGTQSGHRSVVFFCVMP